MMIARFFVDPDTGRPHVEGHGIRCEEVLQVMRSAAFDRPGQDGTRYAEGQTENGRYLRIIYREDDTNETILIITAYELRGKALAAFKRRRRR